MLHLIFLRKILAHKHATFHIRNRCATVKTIVKNIKLYFLILIFCGCRTSKSVKTNICIHEVGIPSIIEIRSNSYSTSDYGVIRGQFLNRIDSLPIANGLVKFTEFITIADENGKFSIDLPPHSLPYDIEFSYLGFNSISKNISLEMSM